MAEPGNPRRSKLDWFKAIRGADLTSAEVHLLALLVGYSNAQGENAYPGLTRLADDSGLSERQVRRILRSLEDKRAIAVTQEGGNQTFKGAATVYMILTVPKRPKGDTDDRLKGDAHDPLDGDKSGSKGAISSSKGDIWSPEGGHYVSLKGDTHVPPSGYHQVLYQVL